MKAMTMRQWVLTSAMTFGALAVQSRVADARTQCPAPGPNQVTLYQLVNYSGSCQVLNLRPDRLPTGYDGYDGGWDFNSGSLTGLYYTWDTLFARNSISSVKVGPGVYLTLFYTVGTPETTSTSTPAVTPGSVGLTNRRPPSASRRPIETAASERTVRSRPHSGQARSPSMRTAGTVVIASNGGHRTPFFQLHIRVLGNPFLV